MTKTQVYYMSEWSAIREWAFDELLDSDDYLWVYSSDLYIGWDNWSYEEMYEQALVEAKEYDPESNITSPSDIFVGYCYFTYDGLKQWAKGGGLPLVFGGFGNDDEERNTNTKKIEQSIINFCNKSKINFSLLNNQYAKILLKDAKPDQNGKLFLGDRIYTDSYLVKLQNE